MVILDRSLPLDADTVLVDHRGGAREATRHLLQMDHRRIALLTPGDRVWPGCERAVGFRQAYRTARLPLDERWIVRQQVSTNPFAGEVHDLLSLRDPPTAIIVLSTRMMAGALRAIRQSGLSISRDVSVVGVSDTDLTSAITPAVTVVRRNLAELGRTVVRLMTEN